MIVKAEVYNDIDDLWRDAVIACLDSAYRYQAIKPNAVLPSRAGDVYGEVIGYHTILRAECQRTFLRNSVRGVDPAYCAAEVLWCFSGDDSTAPLLPYAPSYQAKYGEPDGIAYGAYGSRLMPQFTTIYHLLKEYPLTRQAIMLTWRDNDLVTVLAGNKKDIPCLVSWQFMVRDGNLHMVVNMRANDAWLGLPCDIFAFTCFQRVLAAELGVGVGLYHHFIGTLHLYDKHREKAMKAVKWPARLFPGEPHGWELDTSMSHMRVAIVAEKRLRSGDHTADIAGLPSMAYDLVAACNQKLKVGPKLLLTSPRLKHDYADN